jgi:5-formyltetrahydrofolate cyclo-ligase
MITVERRAKRPRGVKWELLEPEQVAATPPLQELRRMQGLA